MTTYPPFYPRRVSRRAVHRAKTFQPKMAGEAGQIMLAVAAAHKVTVAELCGPSRQRRIAWPRQELMWALYDTGRYSMPQIGRFIGGRDHTTALHGIRRHEERLAAPDVTQPLSDTREGVRASAREPTDQ